MSRRGGWIATYTGGQFWPLDPRPEEINFRDIAHALALQCRYAGHSLRFYSVAEHCCHVHDAAAPEHRAWALLHDASEAYLSDIVRPIKPRLAEYLAAEAALMAAMARHFGLPEQMPAAVKDLDDRILADERARLINPAGPAWENMPARGIGARIAGWPPMRAEEEFLRRLFRLAMDRRISPEAVA